MFVAFANFLTQLGLWLVSPHYKQYSDPCSAAVKTEFGSVNTQPEQFMRIK